MKTFNKTAVKITFVVIITGCFYSCRDQEEGKTTASEMKESIVPVLRRDEKNLNINILIDLSNRIDPAKNKLQPKQQERDKAVVEYFVKRFKENVANKGAFSAMTKLRVFFHPEPADSSITNAAKMLDVSCDAGNSVGTAKRNKELCRTVEQNFSSAITTVYQLAEKQHDYPGSDIWRFMKDEVRRQCIEDSREFRNILVILTDGYMYYKFDRFNQGNRYSYIERNYEHFTRFRENGLLNNEFDQKDFGFIKANDGLHELEVIVMEVSPDDSYPMDYDIIKRYWEKWLHEMGVKHYAVFKTEQPAYLSKIIGDFLNYR